MMKYRKLISSFLVISIIYFMAALAINTNDIPPNFIDRVAHTIPVMILLALATFILRFLRWYYLLTTKGYKIPLFTGFYSYIAGFSLTATPGKIGELIRIRYYENFGVPATTTVSAFIFERALDLIVVLILASVLAFESAFFPILLGIISCLLFGLYAATKWSFIPRQLLIKFHRMGFKRPSKLGLTLIRGLHGIQYWLTPSCLLISLFLGVCAWSILSLAFIALLNSISLSIPFSHAFAAYPIAMLVGAVSMVPAGLGTTEATLIGQLMLNKVPLIEAGIAAIAIRLTTIWFAVFIGCLSVTHLELNLMGKHKFNK